jgi:alkylation response protein AidB-like acyl-CoA dehydrogenase
MRAELLPRLATGRILGAFAQTEAGAGSDFARITSTAKPDRGGGLRLSGEKVWIGNGSWAAVLTVVCQICGDDGEPYELGAYVVPTDSPGVGFGSEHLSMGLRGMVQSKLSFRDVALTDQQRLGEEGQGLDVAVDSMTFTRFALSAVAQGCSKRCLQLMHRYVSRRPMGSGRLLDKPVVLAHLGEVAARTACAGALLSALGDMLDRSGAVDIEPVAACKIAATEFMWQAADRLVQMLGSRGYDETNGAAQILRDARVYRIFEGPTESLLEFLGARAMMNRSTGVFAFLRDELRAPEIAGELDRAVTEICERSLSTSSRAEDAAHAYRASRAGEVVVWALLRAAVARSKGGERGVPKGTDKWAERRFATVVARATQGDERDVALEIAGDIARTLDDVTLSVGDVDVSLPGESLDADTLLVR